MKFTFKNIIGKILLAGITYYDSHENFIEQKQFFGEIISADKSGIKIKKQDGEIFALPPDLSALIEAKPGIYTLRSTGETVENPDLLTTWELILSE